MAITVVTSRADDGTPATRDVYTNAVSYTTVSGDLEVRSAKRLPLAFYGSGNWLSVYVDESVTVFSAGSDGTGSESYLAALALAARAAVQAPGTADAVDEGASLPADTLGTEDAVEEAASGTEDGLDTEDATADWDARLDEADIESPAEMPHPPDAAEREEPPASTPRPESDRPPWMRPVVIRPRTYSAPPRAEAPRPGNSRMRVVAFRAKTYTQAPRDAEPERPRPQMRTVVIRPKNRESADGPPRGVEDQPTGDTADE